MAFTTSPLPTLRMDWWCRLFTCSSCGASPITCDRNEWGYTETSWPSSPWVSPVCVWRMERGTGLSVLSGCEGMSCQRVPPRATLSTWVPRQMVSRGLSASTTRGMSAHSKRSRKGLMGPHSGRGSSP